MLVQCDEMRRVLESGLGEPSPCLLDFIRPLDLSLLHTPQSYASLRLPLTRDEERVRSAPRRFEAMPQEGSGRVLLHDSRLFLVA